VEFVEGATRGERKTEAEKRKAPPFANFAQDGALVKAKRKANGEQQIPRRIAAPFVRQGKRDDNCAGSFEGRDK